MALYLYLQLSFFNFAFYHNISFFGQSHTPASQSRRATSFNSSPPPTPFLPSPGPIGLSQPFTVWLTEIPEIQADGSSPWLMMSQADPFLCPLRSRSNPPQFPYVVHDKSHHAFQLTLLGHLFFFHFSLSLAADLGGLGGRVCKG